MRNSPRNPHPHPQKGQNDPDSNTQKRICDFCSESVALLYCRADSAKLCLSCDREVHSTNQLFTKHTRFQLCDGCDSSPASIFCVTEDSVLCQNCDYELHSLSPNHDRRPLEGFTGCPSVAELSGFVGFEGFDCKSLVGGGERERLVNGVEEEEENDGFDDLFGWVTPAVVSIDDLILSTDKVHDFQAMVVSPLPKYRNLSCGKHKQEILCQLRELAKVESVLEQDSDVLGRDQNVADENEEDFRIQHMIQAFLDDEEHATLQAHEAKSFTLGNDDNDVANDTFLSSILLGSHNKESVVNFDTHTSMCCSAVVPKHGLNSYDHVGTELSMIAPKVAPLEFGSIGRDSAISRYKEKKRTRRYDRHIRYESRKVQAEGRTRIKGRFAKDRPPHDSGVRNSLPKNRYC